MKKTENTNIGKVTPSEFYRIRRPEYFSDSEIIYDVVLTEEHLAFQLAQITTNQKQDEFETLCRKLAEKFISPNLIPQVGPTGGGDGKTDTETHPVSKTISERWFVPENGWTSNEKWAFAFSAKKTWKSKAEGDIKKIIETNRGYTRIYFITNQTPSSKKKKDAQDDFIERYNVDIIILDGEWILKKVFDNQLIDLVVDSLNLSPQYKNKRTIVGQNDAYREKKLIEIEDNINNPNRYFEFDFQLVEDALESAILSRKLGKPREEIEGKFDRAFRFCKKLNNNKQWIRLHYQRAWTYLYYYDDYSAFIEEFKKLKEYISENSSISEIELYVNLFSSLRGFCASNCNLVDFDIDLPKEKDDLYKILDEIKEKEGKPCSSLIAKTYKSIQKLMDSANEEKNPNESFIEISNYLTESIGLIDFPFYSFKKIIEEIGMVFPNNPEYDNLLDIIASISENRTSELAAGETFLRRGSQKLVAKYYKESIIYFGKAVLKLAKEESNDGLFFALKGLANAYSEMGLIWASNNCLISASSISFRRWYEEGILDKRIYYCVKELAINEQFIGRLPIFLTWHELFHVVSTQIDNIEESEEIPIFELLDACLAIRFLNTNSEQDSLFTILPDLLEKHDLWLSQNACLYKLGYSELIIDDYKGINIQNEKELDKHYEMVAKQPFRSQMLYESNFMHNEEITLSSKILGCVFNIRFKKDIELLFSAETFLAFFESFLATSLTDVYPNTEFINIDLVLDENEESFHFLTMESSNEYKVRISRLSFKNKSAGIRNRMIEFTAHIIATNFFIEKPFEYLENLFKKEEVNERLTFIFEHRNFTINVLGDKPKLFLQDWIENKNFKDYPIKRAVPINYPFENGKNSNRKIHPHDLNEIGHGERKISSIIDINLWDNAKWKGFGFFFDSQGLCIFIGYENGDVGKTIFNNWIKRFGREDKEECIRITIIKGVDKNHPNWYKVHIGSEINMESFGSNEIILATSRYREMEATSSINLDNLISAYKSSKFFRICPAQITLNETRIKLFVESTIIKKKLIIRNAWEIGLQDIESIVIRKGDCPIIPENLKSAPVLEILKKREEQN